MILEYFFTIANLFIFCFKNRTYKITAIDNEIISHYKLYDSNLVAHATLNKEQTDSSVVAQLNKRMESLTSEQKHWLLTMYANPVSAKQAL